MVGLTISEVHNSFSNITEENNIFKFYTDAFDEFSFTELKHELAEIVDNSKNLQEPLPDKIIGPRNFRAFKKLETEKRRTDGCYMLLLSYAQSLFPDFETYLRNIVGLDEDDI